MACRGNVGQVVIKIIIIIIDLAFQDLAARSILPPLTDGKFQTNDHLKMSH